MTQTLFYYFAILLTTRLSNPDMDSIWLPYQQEPFSNNPQPREAGKEQSASETPLKFCAAVR